MKNMVVANDALMGDFMGVKANKEYKAAAAPAAQIAGDALLGNFMDIEYEAGELALAA